MTAPAVATPDCEGNSTVTAKRRLWLFIALAGLIPAGGRALEDHQGPIGGTFNFYGQFAPSAIYVDDGTHGYFAFADNSHSVSRLGFNYRHPMKWWDFRFRFETQLGFRTSKSVSQTGRGYAYNPQSTDIRYVDASLEFSKGRVFYFGHGSMATDHVAQADLSGTTVANSVSVPDMAGSFQFRTGSGLLSGIAVKDAYNTFEGVRRNRIRYDSEPRYGLTFSVSAGSEILQNTGEQVLIDTALTYEGKFRGIKIVAAGGASYTQYQKSRSRNDIVGSFSALHEPSGVSFTTAGGKGASGGQFAYFKLGYQRDWIPAGKTMLSVDYQYGNDIAFPGSLSTAVGFAVVQNFKKPGVDLYLGLREYGLSGGLGISYRDIRAVQFGTRYQF